MTAIAKYDQLSDSIIPFLQEAESHWSEPEV